MITRIRLPVILLISVLEATAAFGRPPNIVLIMADDVGYECFGCYGSKQYKTPRLDALAASGVRFTHCHSTPLCTPSRVKIMTGQDNVRNYVDFGHYPKGQFNFAQMVKACGYTTGFAGKWQLEGQGLFPKDVGFDNVCRLINQWPRYWETPIALDGKSLPVEKGVYGPDRFTEFAAEFIAKNMDEPFLFYFPMTLVHSPFPPTPGSEDRNSRNEQKNFEDMVSHMDRCIGRILDALKKAGIADNTVVFFTGDNGTHSKLRSTLGDKKIRGGKGYTKDHGTHVPLIVAGPGVPPGVVCEDLIDFSDFMPTIAEISGADLPADRPLEGRSFWPQCRGQAGKPREWLFNYYFPRPFSPKYDRMYHHFETRWVRDKRYKLYGNGLLFDTVEDVLEISPVPQGTLPEVRKKLQAALNGMPSQGTGIDYSRIKPATKQKAEDDLILHYDRPAESWQTEALPIGNGRLGAMVFSGVDCERIHFNEDSL